MENLASEVACALYRSGCLKFGSFRIKSGATSPYYVDLACLLSSPGDFCTLVDLAAAEIKKLAAFNRIDKLASIELKGALLLPSIGCQTGLPCVVVRKEEKSYGAVGRIAGGDIAKGERILFFDDVVSEGLSKLDGIRPLEEAGACVEDVMVVIDREQGGRDRLEKLGYKVHAMAKISDAVLSLNLSRQITSDRAEAILSFIRKA